MKPFGFITNCENRGSGLSAFSYFPRCFGKPFSRNGCDNLQ